MPKISVIYAKVAKLGNNITSGNYQNYHNRQNDTKPVPGVRGQCVSVPVYRSSRPFIYGSRPFSPEEPPCEQENPNCSNKDQTGKW